MADLPHTWPGYIQLEESSFKSAVSEYTQQRMGQAMNFLYDSLNSKQLKMDFFTANGTWIAPALVTRALIIGCGGGSGGNFLNTGSPLAGQNARGGLGAQLGIHPVNSITTGGSYAVTIGSGGAGSTSNSAPGSSGGNSTFSGPGVSLSFYGASPDNSTYTTGSGSSTLAYLTREMLNGQASNSANFPRGNDTGFSPYKNSGGGAGPFGPGADGSGDVGFVGVNGYDAAANSGGGGGGCYLAGSRGGNGGSGLIIVVYNG